MNRFQEPYNEKSLKKIKRLKSQRQGCSQDLNWPLQDNFWRWRHHYDADVIIAIPGGNMKNFQYFSISLNMVHTGGLCEVLGFTAPLILISKKFWSKYIYTLNSPLCASNCTSSDKTVTFGYLIDMVAYKPYKVNYFLAHILNPIHPDCCRENEFIFIMINILMTLAGERNWCTLKNLHLW